LRRGMAFDDRLASRLSRVLATELGARAAVRAAGATAWERRQFARWLFEDYPRALLATPWRWRRRALHAAGAYPGIV
ncbi:MAG TPA: hypothetical protein VMU14_03945, partial [Acidimicrobiales bacterium]|nr:hypothetical protein [Acidimicrobiales bacterium]